MNNRMRSLYKTKLENYIAMRLLEQIEFARSRVKIERYWKLHYNVVTQNELAKENAYVHQSDAARKSWETGRQRQSLGTEFIHAK